MWNMIELDVLITGAVGIVSSIVSAWTSWFFTRKKYNTDIDSQLIQNMKESLEFYKKLSDDNKLRLDDVLKRNEELERRDEKLEDEVRQLKNQMLNLMSQICLDLTCKVRQKELFGNGTNTEKKI